MTVINAKSGRTRISEDPQEESTRQKNRRNLNMVKVTKTTYSTNSRRIAASRQSVARAAQLIRNRMVSIPRAPPRTGGFYGLYSKRGRDELKVIDTNNYTVAVPTAGSVVLLNGVAQGTDYTNRIGRKVIMKSFLFRATLFPSISASAVYGSVIRIMLVYDCQTNGTTPAITDFLAGGTYNEAMNLTNRDRFKIIKDWFIPVEATVYAASSLTNGSPKNHCVKLYKKMAMEEIFGGTAATVGSIQTGGMFLVYIASAANWNIDYASRIRFIDS